MDISSQDEGKIYLPSSSSQGNDGYMPPGMRTADTPAWSTTTYSPPAHAAGYDVSTHEGNYANYNHASPAPDPSKGGRILGLRRTTFILSVIIAILALALALGLGIGLGVGRNEQKNGQDGSSLGANQQGTTDTPTPSTATPTSTSFDTNNDKPTTIQTRTISQLVTVTAALPTVLPLDCPSPADPSPTIKLLGQDGKPVTKFEMKCGKDNIGFDIMNTMAYSLDDCMRACAMYNFFSKPLVCAGVQFWKDIEDATRKWDGNCFLKSEVAKTLGNKAAGDTVWAEVMNG